MKVETERESGCGEFGGIRPHNGVDIVANRLATASSGATAGE
jgi:hypothetical protein